MNHIYKIISNIDVCIDRINLSLPINSGYRFENQLIDFKYNNSGLVEADYLKNIYSIYGSTLHTSRKISTSDEPIRPRLFCNLVKPNDTSQQFISEIFDDIFMGKTKGDYGAILNQVEVAFDIYPYNTYDLQYLKRFVNDHLMLKYAKIDTFVQIDNTIYAGNKGNVRKAYVGLRMYPKPVNDPHYYRIEFQFNRKYLRNNNVTYMDMPLNPSIFKTLDRIHLLDDFADKGIKNIYRMISKNIYFSSSKQKRSKLALMSREKIRTRVLGGSRGESRCVRDQINQIKRLRKKFKLSSTYRNFFPKMDKEFQLIKCLSAIGIQEEFVSKRICFCLA